MPEQQRIRREKREKLLNSGGEAYPVVVDRTISITDLRDKYVVLAEGENEPESTPAHAVPVTYLPFFIPSSPTAPERMPEGSYACVWII